MCYFVTVAVHRKDSPLLFEAMPARHVRVVEFDNRSILQHFPPDYETFAIMTGMCSCELFGHALPEEDANARQEKYRHKHRRMGWSEAKIERALAAAESHPRRAWEFVGLREDLRAVLAAVAEQGGDVAVVAHFYSSSEVEAEACQLTAGPHLSPEEFRHAPVPSRDDEIVWVRDVRP